jgi:hypothetical protein
LDAALRDLRAAGWGGGGDWAGFGDWAARRDLSANAEARKNCEPRSGKSNEPNGGEPPSQNCAPEPVDASGASVDQVDCLVRADIDMGHIRRLTVGVFPAQIHVTILALRCFSPRPLAGFQRA